MEYIPASGRWTGHARKPKAPFRRFGKYPLDFIELALLDPPSADAAHTRALPEAAELTAVCSLGLPEEAWDSVRPDNAIDFLRIAID